LLLSFGQGVVPLPFPLDPIAKAVLFQPGFAFFGRVGFVCIDVSIRVALVEYFVKVLAVVRTGGVGLDLADDFVSRIDADRYLVAEVAFPMLLRPGGVEVFLTLFRRSPRLESFLYNSGH
jgi:hypothetical protein